MTTPEPSKPENSRSLRIFTINSGTVEEGAEVQALTLKGANMTIPAIMIGEEGRGRERGVIPVELLPERYRQWTETQEAGKKDPYLQISETRIKILAAVLGETKAGKPKLFDRLPEGCSPEEIIAVFRTQIGFRGGNEHTGDRNGQVKKDWYGKEQPDFHAFPGKILSKGIIAEGMAGRAGSGTQMIAVVPKGTIFRTCYSGRLYGGPQAHYYLWDGSRLLSATWDEREASDIF